MSFSQQIRHDKSFHLAPKSKNCQFATFQCYAERSRAIPCSMVINTRKLWGVTKKVQLITMRTLITMTFQMVLISWVYIWPQNRPKRSLSNLSWNFWVFPVTSSGRNGKQKGGECFCFGNFLALFVLPSLLCAHSHQERENWEKPSLVLITH